MTNLSNGLLSTGIARALSEGRFAREWKCSQLSTLMQTSPHLVYNYNYHKQQIDSKRPHYELLKPSEVTPGNKVLFQSGELFWFERGQYQFLIGGGNRTVSFVFWGHAAVLLLPA